MRLWELSLLQDGGMVPWVHIQVLTLPTDQSWESTLSHTNTLNISPSSSPPARKFCRDPSGYGCPVHDLWRMMEGAGLCGDPVIQCSAVPGSSLRVLTMQSVRAQDLSHYGLEASWPKPSPHLSKSLVGSQGTSLSISPRQGEHHPVSIPPWWERPSH